MEPMPEPTTISIASTSGVTIALHDFGGGGSPVLITHGTGFHGRAYGALAARLRERFSVWAVDFRGHGASTKPDGDDFSWDRIADDLQACIDTIGSPIRLVGHSLGAVTGLLVAKRNPAAIERAWLFEPVVFSTAALRARPENPMVGPTMRRRKHFPSRAAALERYGSKPPLNGLDPRCLADYVAHGFRDIADGDGDDGVELACLPEHEALVYDAEERATLELIAGTELRCVVAAGGADPMGIVSALSPPLVERLPHATLETWPTLTHFGPLEAPDLVAPAVVAALS